MAACRRERQDVPAPLVGRNWRVGFRSWPESASSSLPTTTRTGSRELLAEKFAGRGSVERNVRLSSRSGGRARQIDVLVHVPLPGMDDELMVVDCKRYGTPVDIKDVEAFIGMVEDVGAAIGLLVTTEGYTSGALARAAAARGIRVQVIRVEDLPTWEPPLIVCAMCADSVPEDSMPGMVYIDQVEDIDTEDGDSIEVTLGYCEKCAALHLECPECATVNIATEWRAGEWLECEGGCGVTFYLRREATKDDLSNPAHERLTLKASGS
jgi:hypothetical protein